jgi:hypothetical protein
VRRLLPMGLLAVLPACGTGAVPAAEVGDAVESLLEQQVGVRPDVVCPDDLAPEAGAETRCTLTAGGDPTAYGVTVTITAFEGDQPTYQVEVDPEPLG